MKKVILILACVAILIPNAKSQQTTTNDGEFKVRNQTTKGEKSKDDDEKAFKEGTFDVTIGYGYPNMYKSLYQAIFTNGNSSYSNSEYSYTVKGIGPAFIKFEYGLSKLIGLGAVIGYSDVRLTETDTYQSSVWNSTTSSYDYTTYHDTWKYTYTSLSIGARLNFHFGTGKKLDPYAGVGAGYSRKEHKFTFSTDNPNQSTPTPTTFNAYFPVYFGITAGLRYYFTPNIGIYGEVGFDKWSLIQGGLAVKI